MFPHFTNSLQNLNHLSPCHRVNRILPCRVLPGGFQCDSWNKGLVELRIANVIDRMVTQGSF